MGERGGADRRSTRGSYYVEYLTDELERRARALVDRVEAMGGAAKAIANGFMEEEIARSAYEFQLRVESGATAIIGVNKFADGADPPTVPVPDYSQLEREQVARLVATRSSRDAAAVERTLVLLGEAAEAVVAPQAGATAPLLMPLIIEAVKARATVGEISATLAAKWGKYLPRA